MNKVIIIFAIILVVFVGFVALQFNKAAVKGQNALQQKELTIKNQKFTVEIASTAAQQEQGLSGRTKLNKDQGMLFVFDRTDLYNFWMKDMKFPLDMIFINNDKVVAIIENAEPPKDAKQDPPILQPGQPANRILEINAGLVKEYDIKVGDSIKVSL